MNSKILSKYTYHFLLVLLLTSLGCGKHKGDLGDVSGRITLNGKPLSMASVVFYPDAGRSSYGFTDANGTYELKYTTGKSGALIGAHKVRISNSIENEDPDSGKVTLSKEGIPPSYNERTTLTANVESGTNYIPFDLTSEIGPPPQL